MTETRCLRSQCKASVYIPSITPWSSISDSIIQIGKQHFGFNSYTEEEIRTDFTDPTCVAAISRDVISSRIIGYTYAAPLTKYPDEVDYSVPRDDNGESTVYIWGTAIEQEYIGQRIVEDIMCAFETELERRRIKYIERNSKSSNGFSEKIRNIYGDKIIYSKICFDEIHGGQEFFRIKLS